MAIRTEVHRDVIALLIVLALTPGIVTAQSTGASQGRVIDAAIARLLRETPGTHAGAWLVSVRETRLTSTPQSEFDALRRNEERNRTVDSVASSAAPQSTDWSRVKALRVRQPMSVDVAGGRRLRGRLIAVDDTSLTLEVGGDTHRIGQPDIIRITAGTTRRIRIGVSLAAIGGGLVIANAATRPAEAGPGRLWLVGAPLAVIGGVLIYSATHAGVIYRQP